MVANLFLTIALLSITGSAAYILLKLLTAASGGRLSQNWRYNSITAVSLLYVLPLYRIWALIPVAHPALPSIVVAGSHSDSTYIPSISTDASELPLQIVPTNGGVDWDLVIKWAAVLWLLGAAGLIIWNGCRLLHYRRMFEQASNKTSSHLQQIAQEAAHLAGVTNEVQLLVCALVQTPMLVGFLRPTILLPLEHIPDSDAKFILTHELTHFRRRDLWKKFLVNMIRCVHWFNPIVYLLSRDFAYWLETSCDEDVVSSLDYAQRKEYGYLLINYAPTARYVGLRLYVPFSSCRYKLKRRISVMMESNKKARSLLGLVLAIVLVVGCLATTALAANLGIEKSTAPALSDIKEPIADVESAASVSVDKEAVANAQNDLPNNGPQPLSDESVVVDVDSAILDELGRATLTWSNQKINYDTRMRFISSYTGGYFTLSGVTATFTVTIANGNSETIEIDWYDSDGNSTVLYSGTTNSATVSYTATSREQGNFRVWNKAAAAITVDASISY